MKKNLFLVILGLVGVLSACKINKKHIPKERPSVIMHIHETAISVKISGDRWSSGTQFVTYSEDMGWVGGCEGKVGTCVKGNLNTELIQD